MSVFALTLKVAKTLVTVRNVVVIINAVDSVVNDTGGSKVVTQVAGAVEEIVEVMIEKVRDTKLTKSVLRFLVNRPQSEDEARIFHKIRNWVSARLDAIEARQERRMDEEGEGKSA